MLSLSDNKRADVIDAINSTSRYLVDVLDIDNPYIEQMENQIYPTELQSCKVSVLILKTPILNLDLPITNGIGLAKIYNKRDDLSFEIVR